MHYGAVNVRRQKLTWTKGLALVAEAAKSVLPFPEPPSLSLLGVGTSEMSRCLFLDSGYEHLGSLSSSSPAHINRKGVTHEWQHLLQSQHC